MKTNRIMDEIRSTISPEMKMQMEMSVSRWLSGTHNLTMATICKISAALDAEVVKVTNFEQEPAFA